MPDVSYKHPDLRAMLSTYNLINDCLRGEQQVKSRGEKYLPRPNPEDNSPENALRYEDYLARAVFYNVTARTLRGMIGEIFARDPEMTIGPRLKLVMADITGLGVTGVQLTREACSRIMGFGRGGFFADFPNTETKNEDGSTSRGATVAELASGKVRPTVGFVQPWDIVNWRWDSDGANKKLVLLVMRERYTVKDDGFLVQYGEQFRVLRLNNGQYSQTVYRKNAVYQSENFATDFDNRPLDHIPFYFIGSENNDPNVDPAPLYDLSALNVAHYRNSADYEESCYICGQPTPYFSGLTEAWVNNVLKGTIRLGSRGAVPLPSGGVAGLIQAQSNSMPREAMDAKERQMRAIGARLIVDTSGNRTTATESNNDKSSENSTLKTVADNTGAAMQSALKDCALFLGETVETVFRLNTQYDLLRMTSDELNAVVAAWQAGLITDMEGRAVLRRGGYATEDDKTALADIAAQAAKRQADAIKLAQATKPAPNDPGKQPAAE